VLLNVAYGGVGWALPQFLEEWAELTGAAFCLHLDAAVGAVPREPGDAVPVCSLHCERAEPHPLYGTV
jgi:hypothetical protein